MLLILHLQQQADESMKRCGRISGYKLERQLVLRAVDIPLEPVASQALDQPSGLA